MHFLHIALRRQFSVREYVPQVPRDNRLVPPEEFDHLCLRQPDRLVIESYVHPDLTVRGLVQEDLATGHFSRATHASSTA